MYAARHAPQSHTTGVSVLQGDRWTGAMMTMTMQRQVCHFCTLCYTPSPPSILVHPYAPTTLQNSVTFHSVYLKSGAWLPIFRSSSVEYSIFTPRASISRCAASRCAFARIYVKTMMGSSVRPMPTNPSSTASAEWGQRTIRITPYVQQQTQEMKRTSEEVVRRILHAVDVARDRAPGVREHDLHPDGDCASIVTDGVVPHPAERALVRCLITTCGTVWAARTRRRSPGTPHSPP